MNPRRGGRADAEGRGMAMAGPSIRRHIHALHPSPWHPLEERKNAALRTEPLHESGQLIPPPRPNISRPLPGSLSPCITKARFPACFFFLNLFIYLFLAVLGLRFYARAFSSCGERGPLFIAVRGPLTIVASLVAEHRLQTRRLSNCGSRAHLLRGMWDLPRPGLEPVSPALAGRFLTTAPPGKPSLRVFDVS